MFSRHLHFALALALVAGTSGCGTATNESEPAAMVAADGLRGEADAPLRAFYESRGWRAAWTDARASELVAALREAARHGLEPQTFLADVDQAREPAERELALSRAALAYADALARGRLDPRRLAEVYTVPRPDMDVAAGLARALEQSGLRPWLESLAPQDEEYRALSAAYVEARRIAAQPAPAGPIRRIGSDPDPADPRVAAARAATLAVNLERRRWLERSPAEQRIDVNTAASFLRYYRGGRIADQRVVVNGELGWETPELGSPLFRLVANPDWTVPTSIERQELGRLSPAALARRHMARENGRIVQQPGPDNALGLVKFDLRNDQAIYLHDTPSKAAFDREHRHLSHGCVRVSDALGFARMIADDMGVREAFERGLASRDTEFVPLPREIPVRLLYQTVFFDQGRLVFVPDFYGWDLRVAQALGVAAQGTEANGRVPRQGRSGGSGDVGP